MSCRLTATELSDQVVSSSGPKLTVSMFCLCIFPSTFSIDGRSGTALETSAGGLGSLLGPLCAVLGRSWTPCWRSWTALGTYVGGLGAALRAYVGGTGRLLGLMLAVLPYVGCLGPLLGPMLAVLGGSWGSCWRSWAALELLQMVPGLSWVLSWRSWAALAPYVGGLGPLLALCWRS